MSKIIYCNGCSWTWGDDLENPQQERFSTLLGEKTKFSIINEAKNEGSNYRIVRTTINYLLTNRDKWEDIIVILGFTDPSRYEFFNEDTKEFDCFNIHKVYNEPHTKRGVVAKNYFSHLYSDELSYETYLNQIIYLQSFLQLHNIKYFFFRAFGYHTFNIVTDHSNRIYNDRVDLENSGSIVDFGDSLKQEISVNNFPSMFEFDKTYQGIINRKVNSLHHPNKEEHKTFADYLHNTLNKLNYLN